MRFGSRREVWLISLGLAAGTAFSLLGHNLLASRQPEMVEKAVCEEAMALVVAHANASVMKERATCMEALDHLKDWRFPEVPRWWNVTDGGNPL